MNKKMGLIFDQNVITEVLVEIYQKANQNENLMAEQVISDIVRKLQPFFEKQQVK